jgi:hypothetical protein
MRSYVKIYGPPVLDAIKELEKIAIDMPQVCIMDHVILEDLSPSTARDIGGWEVKTTDVISGGDVGPFFMRRTGAMVPVERCQNIISKHGEKLGENDFFFEWFEEPNKEQLKHLIEEIDKALQPLGCYYTITTKKM